MDNKMKFLPSTATLALSLILSLCFCSSAQAKTWDELIVQGEREYRARNLPQALTTFEAALVEAQKEPIDKQKLARTLNDLGVVEDELGQYDKAIKYQQRVLTLISDKPDSAAYATALNNLANVFKDQHKYDQAEPLYKQVIGIYEKSTGPDSEFIAMANHNIASLYAEMGNNKDAATHFKLALQAAEKSLGPDNDHVIDTLAKLARIEDKLQNRDEAKVLFKRYLQHVQTLLGLKNDTPDRIQKLKEIVADLKKEGQTGNAELIEKALSYDESSK